jgi:hypothetical protein
VLGVGARADFLLLRGPELALEAVHVAGVRLQPRA